MLSISSNVYPGGFQDIAHNSNVYRTEYRCSCWENHRQHRNVVQAILMVLLAHLNNLEGPDESTEPPQLVD